jgi:hypothetical protein
MSHIPIVLVACIAVAIPSAFADEPMVPDPSWSPRPGDLAVIFSRPGGESVSTRDLATLLDVVKSGKASDTTGVRELLDAGKLVMLPHLTQVRVIERNDLALIAKGILVLEIRVESGEHRDEKLWTLQPYVAQLMRRPPPAFDNSKIPGSNLPRGKVKPVPKRLPSRPVDPETRASGYLQMGKGVRLNGNRVAAVEYFRRAVKEAPESPAAKEAGKILKELGAKP